LRLAFIGEEEFDRVVDPKKMVKPNVTTANRRSVNPQAD
jgi:hypothetical protein